MELIAYINVLQRRWKLTLLIFSVVILLSIFGSSFYSPNYQAETRLRVIPPLGGSLENPYYQTTFASRLMNTYAQIASSELVLNELKEKLELRTLPEINVTIIPDSEIIQIIVSSSDPSLAAKTANALAELTISKQKTAIENSAISEGLSIFTRRIEEMKSELEIAKKEHDELVLNYSQTAAQLAVLDREIQMKETTYQNLLLALGASNEEITRLGNEIDVKNQEFQELSAKSNEYLEQISLIRQTIQNNQSAYTNLVLRYDTVQVTNLMQVSTQNVQIVSPAIEPSTPTGFGRIFVLGLGVLCGLIVSVISAFVFDNLDTRIYSPKQIEDVTGKQVLGNISKIQDAHNGFYLQCESPTFLRDSWKLGIKILKILQNGSIKIILVTSFNSGEGKSTVVSGLAEALAQNNREVLLIDADVRKPQQHISLNYLGKGEGSLNDYLHEKVSSVKDVIQKNVRPNMDLLPSLAESKDPAKLFQSSQLDSLFEQIKKYDIVLFDTPSLTVAPDAYKLATLVDGVIIVAQKRNTTSNDIRALCADLEDIGANFLGVVLNQAPTKRRLNSIARGAGQLSLFKARTEKITLNPFSKISQVTRKKSETKREKSSTDEKLDKRAGKMLNEPK